MSVPTMIIRGEEAIKIAAAAPDLLAALIILRDFLRENGTKSARADAAIAKALDQ